MEFASLRKNVKLGDCGPPTDVSIATQVTKTVGVTGGISGDLGLTDIIVDGLLGVDDTAKQNVYGTSGPLPFPIDQRLSLTGCLTRLSPTKPGKKVDADNCAYDVGLVGQLLIMPPAPGSISAQTVTVPAILTFSAEHGHACWGCRKILVSLGTGDLLGVPGGFHRYRRPQRWTQLGPHGGFFRSHKFQRPLGRKRAVPERDTHERGFPEHYVRRNVF